MTDFEREYKKLNDDQRAAVDAIDGPVMVIAGPGTGKTQLLSMRVARILKTTDTSPSEVLCLTFTEKAATNMRERLGKFIGAEAHNVVIKTFHGFGAEIMNLYADYFWNAARLVAAPDAVQLEIIESILRKLPHRNPLALRFAGNPTLTRDVRDALKYAKEAGLTPEKLEAMIRLNLAYIDEIEADLSDILADRISKKTIDAIAEAISSLPDHDISADIAPLQPLSEIIKSGFEQAVTAAEEQGKTTPISNWKRQWFQTRNGKPGMHGEKRRNEWWLTLADVYKDYREILHSRGYFDYADMIIEVITQLEQNDNLRAEVQERFNYVLIDEFQDTNEAQMRMVHLVADHPVAEGNPNIMTVGDDDQAIYKFQGAELNNLLNFRRSYPKTRVIVLKDNYRSHQSVLDLAKQVIEQADNRLVNHEKDIDKNIRQACDQPSGLLRHLSYASQADQYTALAEMIKKDFKPGRDIAVVARNNDSLRSIAAVLHDLDVPVHYDQQNNVFDHPLSRQMILICRVVQALLEGDDSSANFYLAQTLRHPMWQINPETLWQLAILGRRSDWLTNLRDNQECAWIAEWLESLATCATTEHLNVMISEVLGLTSDDSTPTSPIHDFYTKKQELSRTYLDGLSAIRLIRGLVADFSRGRQPSLEEFLRFVDVHEENNLVLADESPFITAPHAVQLLTIYKAKGLEFDSVYVIDAVESVWSPRRGGRKPPANLPLRPAGDDWDDYVRLMYVAVTRAVSDITVTSFRTDLSGKDILPTPIIAHVLPAENQAAPQGDRALKVLETNLTWPRLDSEDEQQLLADTLGNYQLNATAVMHFLDLEKAGPSTFLESHILRLPSAKTPYQSHGTAMHAALELGQRLTNNNSFELTKVIDAYKNSLAQEMLIKQDYARWAEEGERAIRALFGDLGFELKAGNQAERRFSGISCGDCLISGAFDCIEDDGDNISIIDYKTGTPVSNLNSTTKAEGIKAWRHRLQLIFYALIAKSIPEYKGRQISGSMVYVQAEEPKLLRRDYQPSDEEVERLAKLTNKIWQKIKALDMPDTSNYEPTLSGIQQFENDLLNDKI